MIKRQITIPTIAILLLIISSFIIATIAYNKIEEDQVASHWNASGEVDGYMSKFWGLFLIPIALIGIYILFLVIPQIDPLKVNIQKFKKHYKTFILVIVSYIFYIHILTVLFNLGFKFNMTNMIVPGIGMLFFYIGLFMKKLKRNWFIGIRTPWTLSNDKVWAKTHNLGSKLFKISGIIIILSIFLPYTVWVIIISIFTTIIWIVFYSYLEYKKIDKI